MARKIVLTGGTGFILSYVAEQYAALGDTVVLFDNNEQHRMPRYTLDLLEKSKNVSFVSGDICDKAAVEKVIDGADIVYHFAALMGTSSRFKQEVRTVEVNVLGTLHACQAALDAKVKYFVYPPRPMETGWLTPYIISKTASTQFTQMYHQVYGLPTVGLNIANIYGPRERAVLEANTLKPDQPAIQLLLADIHIKLRNYPALLDNLNAYLKLAPTGAQADKVRQARDQLQQQLANAQAAAAPKTDETPATAPPSLKQ